MKELSIRKVNLLLVSKATCCHGNRGRCGLLMNLWSSCVCMFILSVQVVMVTIFHRDGYYSCLLVGKTGRR